jgi:hypothetical protein
MTRGANPKHREEMDMRKATRTSLPTDRRQDERALSPAELRLVSGGQRTRAILGED